MNADVLIVGAGASGLMAARELSKAGKKVVILEARERIGGRIYPLPEEEFGYPAQGGAEFVHGEAPITIPLLKEAQGTLTHPTEWWNVLDGEPQLNTTPSPHDPNLEAKLLELKEDITVQKFFDLYFNTPQQEELRKNIYRMIEGYMAGDPTKASAYALREVLTGQEEWKQQSLKEGYAKLLEYLKVQCDSYGVEIKLNKEVTRIDHTGEGVAVHSKDGSVYEAGKIIISIPAPLIQTITFIPAIPKKIEAASKIGYGAVIKILMRFKHKWWSGARAKNFERMFFMFSYEKIPTWWTQYPEQHLTLTGWVAGPSAENLANKTDNELQNLALKSLSQIFNISLEELKSELANAKVINWIKDPFARGGYSYPTPGSEAAVQELQKPVNDKLFFCGEALAGEPASATVEGALQSGQEVAKEVLLH